MSKLGIESKDHTENHEPETPIRPSAKALGKRRQLDPPESERKSLRAPLLSRITDDLQR